MADAIKTYTIDASFLLSILLPDETNEGDIEYLERYRAGSISLVSSPLLPYEIGNALLAAAKRNRVATADARELYRAFSDLSVSFAEVDTAEVYDLAALTRLTFYDASYLWVARSKQSPLLTRDEALRTAHATLARM
jgi:predicted nucleic acid-binding protein